VQKNLILAQWARKFKKSGPKKLVKLNNAISRKKFFYQIPFFAISKMAKNQFLNREKVQNCQKYNFPEIFSWFIWFQEFFCLDFFKFSDPLCLNALFFSLFSNMHYWRNWCTCCLVFSRKKQCHSFVCVFFASYSEIQNLIKIQFIIVPKLQLLWILQQTSSVFFPPPAPYDEFKYSVPFQCTVILWKV